ncbi:MAG: sialidase family protein [Bacteroidota bacterium]
MKKLFFLCTLCSLIACSSNKNVLIFRNDLTQVGPCEPSIAISPVDPDVLVAGSVLDFVHYSSDGGKTWTTDNLNSSQGVYGDPCVISDQEGNFYYFHLADPEGSRWKSKRILESIVVQRSEDGGVNWTNGKAIGLNPPKQQDKEWAIANPDNGEIYVTWTQFDTYGSKEPDCETQILFSKSSDKGESWTAPFELSQFRGNCIDDDQTVEGAVPAVGPEGNIYVTWGNNEKLYFDRSTDGGQSWLAQDIVVAEQPGGWNMDVPGIGRTNGMPVTCADRSSSKFRGRVYVCWADNRNGQENTDIFLSSSNDAGQSWSKPLRVNQDQTQTHQFFPWMAIDQSNGHIYIVYYDRSKYSDLQNDVVLAVSKDGGQSFKAKTISEQPFEAPGKRIFFGDYNNITVHKGIVRPIWTSFSDGKLSVWTALIKG